MSEDKKPSGSNSRPTNHDIVNILRKTLSIVERGKKLPSATLGETVRALGTYEPELLDSFKLDLEAIFDEFNSNGNDSSQAAESGTAANNENRKSIIKTKSDVDSFEGILESVMLEWGDHYEQSSDPATPGTIRYLQQFVKWLKEHEHELAKKYTFTQYPRMLRVLGLDNESKTCSDAEVNEIMCKLIVCSVVKNDRGGVGGYKNKRSAAVSGQASGTDGKKKKNSV